MRVLLSTYGSHESHGSHESRGDVEPMGGLAVQLWALGAEMPVCAPADFAERLARVGQPVRTPVTGATGATPPSAADLPQRAAELVAAQFDTVAAAAEGCDALVPAMPW